MAKKDVLTLRQTYSLLKTERENMDGTYDLVDRFVVPGKGRFFVGTDSEQALDWRRRELYDDVAVQSAQTLAASIHGAITSPAIKWYEKRFKNDELNDSHEASVWLEEVRDRCFDAILRSNFNVEISEAYLGDVAFGLAYLSHLSNEKGEMRFKNLEIKGVYFEEDFHGNVVGIFIEKEYTVAAIYERFAEKGNIPTEFEEMYKKNPAVAVTEKRKVVHAIYQDYENRDADASTLLGVEERPFRETWFCLEPLHELLVGDGYYEFPVYVLRWGSVAGSKFGYSPAINSMGNILTLNQLVEVILGAAEKAVDPPVMVEDRGMIGDLDFSASAVNVVRDVSKIVPFESKARFDVSALNRQELTDAIKSAFYIDQLQLKDSPAMTATEANIRYELMQRLLGPALTRIKTDLLDKLVHRTFLIQYRAGNLPEIPEIVKQLGGGYEVEYVGPWARAQRADDVLVLEQTLGYAAQMAANLQNPELLRPFDIDEIMKELAGKRGMPAKFMKDQDRIDAERTEEKKQKDMMQQLQMMGAGAAASKDMAAGQKMNAEAGNV